MLFGEGLKLLREEKNITQIELGQALNISNRVIAYYESNDRFPREQSTLVNIANHFDVSLDWLLGRTDIRSFKPDGSNILCIDLEGLTSDDINKIKEYSAMLQQFKKTEDKK